jgi:hypothetical protein
LGNYINNENLLKITLFGIAIFLQLRGEPEKGIIKKYKIETIVAFGIIFLWLVSENLLPSLAPLVNFLIETFVLPFLPQYYILRGEYKRTKEALKMKKEKFPDKLKIIILKVTGNNADAFANKCLQSIAQSQDKDIKNNEQLRNELQEVFKF